MSKRTAMLVGVVCAVVLATVAVVNAGSAAQIFVSGDLQYVKHVNNLPSGTTTLLVRNLNGEQQARIKFSARAVDGTQLSRTIDAKFRKGEEKQFVVAWGKPITDLNFIQIIAVRSSRDGNSGSGGL